MLQAEKFEYAPRNGAAEEVSLNVHLSTYVMCDSCRPEPNYCDIDKAFHHVLREFRSTMYWLPDDFMSRDHFVRSLEDIQKDSSPGYPLMRRFATNGNLFWDNEGVLIPERVEMVWQMVRHQLSTRQCHPIRLFIKSEPHKIAKMEQRRYRLIYSVSIIDTMIDRMLLGNFADRLMENWLVTPSMIGWSPLYGGWKILPYNCVGYDLTAWEYTVPRWLISTFLRVAQELKVGTQTNFEFGTWEELLSWRIDCLFNRAELILSSGRRYRLEVYGIMKSGSFITIMANTIMQRLLFVAACFACGMTDIPRQLAMGDDGVFDEELPAEVLRLVAEWGFIVKDSARNEFCGITWGRGKVEPVYRGKHLAKFRFMPESIARNLFLSYQIYYARSDWFGRLQQIIAQYNPAYLIPRSEALEYFDGPS